MRVSIEGLRELAAQVVLLEEDRRCFLTVRAPRKEDERRVDSVEVAERVESKLERLAPQELGPRLARLPDDGAVPPEPAEAVLDRVSRVDRRDVARVGSTCGRIGAHRDRADGLGRRAVQRPDRRPLVRDRDQGLAAGEAVRVAHVLGDLRDALLGGSGWLPRRPGGSGGRAPAADEDEQRAYARPGDDREQDVERREAAPVGEAPRAVGTRLRTGDDRRAARVRRHRLGVGGGLVHHIVGHELSSARSTAGMVIFDSSSRFRSSSPNSSRRAASTSAMCSTASRFATIRL